MNKSYFLYQKKQGNQCHDKCNDELDPYNDKKSIKQVNPCNENKNDCKTNNCYDNNKNCFCYKYLLGATGPTGPTGLTGATGPTGSSGALSAYGGRYNNTTQTISLATGTQTQITLTNTMPNRNVTYTPANSINIQS